MTTSRNDTESQRNSRNELHIAARKQKSTARQIARSAPAGMAILAALGLFFIGVVSSGSTIYSEWESAYAPVMDTPAAELVTELAVYKLLLTVFVWFCVAATVLEAYVRWKSKPYLELPSEELKRRWLELGGFEERVD